MAKTVAELVVNLTAETAKFRRDMNAASAQSHAVSRQISGHVGQMRQSFDRLSAGVRNFAVAYLGLRGMQMLVSATRDAVAFGAAINDAAIRTGLTTDALQELRFAAEQSGGTVAGLDSGIEQFTRRLGEAANGTGQLGDALAQYNISMTGADGQTRSVEEMLYRYADAIQSAGSETEQMRLTTAAFGRGGVDLVGMLREGGDGLDEMAARAHELGVVMDADVIATAAEADDRMAALSDTLGNQLRTVLIELSPIITGIGAALVALVGFAADAIAGIGDIVDAWNEAGAAQTAFRAGMTSEQLRDPAAIRSTIAQNMLELAETERIIQRRMSGTGDQSELASLQLRATTYRVTITEMQGLLAEAEAVADRLPTVIPRFGNQLAGATASQLEAMATDIATQIAEQRALIAGGEVAGQAALQAGLADLLATQQEVQNYLRAARHGAGGGGGGGGGAANDNNAARDAIVGMDADDRASLDAWNDSLREANALIVEHQTPLQTYTARVAELRGLMTAMTSAGLSAAEAQALINAEIAEAAVVMNDAGEAAAEANQMWADFGNVATNALAAATAEGANFRDVLLGIIQDLLQMASVQKWIGSLFSGGDGRDYPGFLQFRGGTETGGGGGGPFGNLGDWFGNLFGLAEGGPVAPGLTYLVGEQGPELFTSSRGGQIIPNDALGGGGGLTVINNIDARQTDIGVEMRIRAAMAETERRIFAAMNRGGQESKISGRRPA